jgi:opacity protein-like surface antigen
MNKVKLAVATALVGVSLATASVASAATVVGVEYNRGSQNTQSGVFSVEFNHNPAISNGVSVELGENVTGFDNSQTNTSASFFKLNGKIFKTTTLGVEVGAGFYGNSEVAVVLGGLVAHRVNLTKSTSFVQETRYRNNTTKNNSQLRLSAGLEQKLGDNLAVQANYRYTKHYGVNSANVTNGFGVGLKYSF